jgi:sulfur carrier protein
MELSVNDEVHTFKEGANLYDVIQELSISEKGTAIAINEEVVPKSQWHNTIPNLNDKILIIKATQGG